MNPGKIKSFHWSSDTHAIKIYLKSIYLETQESNEIMKREGNLGKASHSRNEHWAMEYSLIQILALQIGIPTY